MIATYDQQIDGKWYRVGEELPSEKPVVEPTPVAEKSEEPKKVPTKKSGKKV